MPIGVPCWVSEDHMDLVQIRLRNYLAFADQKVR